MRILPSTPVPIIAGLRLGEAVASGASGTVYAGWHERAGAVAVKVTHADDDWTATRTMREANAAAALDHEGIVRVVAAGRVADGRAWVAMEWIDGITLEAAIEGARWPLGRVLGVAAQLARALAVAHAAGIVHRDLKPANVMMRAGGADRVVVVDWGIARRAGDPASSASRCAGTPHYMAPEQALGDDVDGRADLYALGCVLVEMLTGRVPFEGSSVEVMLGHLGQPPPPLDDVPADVAALVHALLAKRPDDRPATAVAVAASLERFGAPAPGPAPRRRRGRVALVAALAVALAIGAFAAVRTLRAEPALAGPVVTGPAPLPGAPVPAPPIVTAPDEPVVIIVDGGFSMRATLHGTPVAGGHLVVSLAVWDDADEPLDARQIAATLRTPGGVTTALALTGADGVFRLHHATAVAGEHVLTIFAPSGDTTFTVRFTVGARPSV